MTRGKRLVVLLAAARRALAVRNADPQKRYTSWRSGCGGRGSRREIASPRSR